LLAGCSWCGAGDGVGGRAVVTGEEWDTHWWWIYNDLVWGDLELQEGPEAEAIATRECGEQFGPHPEDVAS